MTAHRNQKPSWAGLEAEASSGHDEESGALTGSLSNRFHFCDRRGKRLGLTSMATTQGAACPRRVSMDKTRKGKFKMFLWAQQDINTALLAGTCGLDPRGLSQRLAGGLESAVGRRLRVSRGRRRDLPRMAGLGEPWTAVWSPANGGPGRAADGGVDLPWTVGLGERLARDSRGWRRISPVIGGLEGSRPADSRRSHRTPKPTWRGLGRKDKWRLPRRLGAHSREKWGTRRRGLNSNDSL